MSSPARGEQSASPASALTLPLTARLDALLAPVLRPYGIEVAVQVRQTEVVLRLTSDTPLDAPAVRRWLVQGFTHLADPRVAQVTVSHYRRGQLEPDWVETFSLQRPGPEPAASPAGGRPAVHYLFRPRPRPHQRRLWPLAPAVAGLAGVLVISPPLVWFNLVAPRPQPTVAASPEAAVVSVADAGLPPGPWPDQVHRSINRTWLTQQFQARGYALPAESGVYAARILPGAAGPAYEFYEAGKGAFSTDFWPASTVKVLAAVAAVEFAVEQGFSGDAQVTFANGFRDRLRHIYDRSIRISSNEDYDWTVRLVGLDWLNQHFLSSERGFPTTVLQRSYTGRGVQVSPRITFQEGERKVSLPPRASYPKYPCPNQGNCANLFEMTEVVRRVILHEEVPPQERFRLPPQDVAGLTEALCHSDPSLFRPGVAKVLGEQAEVCHKPGWVPGDDCLDAGVVRDPASGERYLLAAVVPYTSGRACDQLATIAEHTLLALRQEPPGAPLQPDAGPPIQVQVAQPGVEGRRQHGFTVTVEGADRVEVYLDDHRLVTLSGPGPAYQFQVGLSRSGERLMRVQAWAGPQVLAFRSLKVQIEPLSTWCQPEHATPLKPEVIRRGPAGRAQVALTFDDGPDPVQTPKILDMLKAAGIRATFFVQGRRAQQYPHLIRRIVREGHELGNHTMNHRRREKLPDDQVDQEILATQKVLCDQGLVQSQLFRPPYGEFQPQDLDRVAASGLRLVLWDVDTRDWQHRNPGQTVQAVVKQTRPGSIILLHDIFTTTTQALPEVITTLRQRGLQPVTVSELLQPTQPASAPGRGRPQASQKPNATASEFPRLSAGG